MLYPSQSLLIDVDECINREAHCAEGCYNTIGSYNCYYRCENGYTRTSAGLCVGGKFANQSGVKTLF